MGHVLQKLFHQKLHSNKTLKFELKLRQELWNEEGHVTHLTKPKQCCLFAVYNRMHFPGTAPVHPHP
jgi:hypothetical protein